MLCCFLCTALACLIYSLALSLIVTQSNNYLSLVATSPKPHNDINNNLHTLLFKQALLIVDDLQCDIFIH